MRARCGGDKSACKPDSVPLGGGDHPSGTDVANGLMRSTRRHRAGRPSAQAAEAALLDLAPGGVCRAAVVAYGAGGLLHHRFTLAPLARGGLFSVALSRGSPRVGVTHHPALWSPDFPRSGSTDRGRPADLSSVSVVHALRRWPRACPWAERLTAPPCGQGHPMIVTQVTVGTWLDWADCR